MMETEHLPTMKQQQILCALCNLGFNPGTSNTNICSNCIINQTDITLGITKEGVVNFCRFCHRYLRPPWVLCERESKELLSICLKRLRGLNKVKIIDAAFVYSDVSTKRIKIKLTVQKEVMNNVNMQQVRKFINIMKKTFISEFQEYYQQCDECKKEFTPHTWTSSVQIRQKVQHKKTFFYLEQLLLKHSAHDKVLSIQNVDDGLDFFYKTRSHAVRLIDFLQSVLPIRVKQSKQLVSHDANSNSFFYKYCYSVELPKICKDDLVVIPLKMAKDMGGISQVLLCYKVSTVIHLLDPRTMKSYEVISETYEKYENEIRVFSLKANGTEFTIVDTEEVINQNLNESFLSSSTNYFLKKIRSIQVISDSEYEPIYCKCHLGSSIKVGNVLIGFNVKNMVADELQDLKNIPDVVLVRRKQDKTEQKRQRIFKLKRLEQQNGMEEEGKKKKKEKHSDVEEEYEEFLEDVEKDKEMRKNMNLYRNEEAIAKLSKKELKKREISRANQASKKEIEQRKIIKIKKKGQQEEEEKKQDSEEEDWDSVDDDDEVKLNELMRDLQIDDKEVLPLETADKEVDDFVSQLDKVKIDQ